MVVLAILMPKRPVVLLYVRGPLAERFVRLILVATIPERMVTFPERVLKLVVRFERLVLVVMRVPEREAISPVAVERFEFVVARLVKREAISPVAVERFVRSEVMELSWRVLDPWSFWNA